MLEEMREVSGEVWKNIGRDMGKCVGVWGQTRGVWGNVERGVGKYVGV